MVDGKLKTCEEKIEFNRENVNNNRVRIDTSAQKIAEISINLAKKESIERFESLLSRFETFSSMETI